MVDFFNRINLIYGTVSEYCNETTCPTMSGGPRYEYLWADGENFKKPTQLPAPKYVEYLMDWTESQINNERYQCFFGYGLYVSGNKTNKKSTFKSLCCWFVCIFHLRNFFFTILTFFVIVSVYFLSQLMFRFQKHFNISAGKYWHDCSESLCMFISIILTGLSA